MDDATYKIRVKLLHLLTPKTDKSSTFSKDFELFLKIVLNCRSQQIWRKSVLSGKFKNLLSKHWKNFIKTKKSISKNSSNWSDIQILHTKRVQIFRLVNFISFYEFCKKNYFVEWTVKCQLCHVSCHIFASILKEANSEFWSYLVNIRSNLSK